MPAARSALPGSRFVPPAVILVVLGFVMLGCLWIEHPGLQYDEVLFTAASYPNPTRGGAGYVEVFGRPVCTMVLPYLGALKGWLFRLIFVLAPPSAAAVRVPAVLLGAFTLLLLFWFARRVFDERTALIAAALAASDPTFLFTTRLDWGPVVLQRLCWLGGCLLLLRWRDRPTAVRLFAAAAVFGVGLFDKLTFVWMLAALSAAGLAAFPKSLASGVRWKTAAVFAPAFLLGCLPLVVYRLGFPTRSLGLHGENGLAPYLAKLSMLYHCFDGRIFQGWLAEVTAPHPTPPAMGLGAWICRWNGDALIQPTWFPWALAASLALLPWTLRSPSRRGLLFVLVFSAAAVAMMLPVESAGSAHHLALIEPFPQLFVAASLTAAASWTPGMSWPRRLSEKEGPANPRLAMVLVAGVAFLLVLANLRAVAQQYSQILQFGGTPPWSEAIYTLRDRLRALEPQQSRGARLGNGHAASTVVTRPYAVAGSAATGG